MTSRVRPLNSGFDLADSAARHSESIGNILVAAHRRIDFSDYITSQPRLTVALSSGLSFSFDHVSDVLNLSAEKKMGWIDASRVVASVSDDHTARNIAAVLDTPSDVRSAAKTPANTNFSIPIVVNLSVPQIAARQCFGHGIVVHRLMDGPMSGATVSLCHADSISDDGGDIETKVHYWKIGVVS